MNTDDILRASKYTVLVAVVAALLGHLLMMYIGTIKVYKAFKIYLLMDELSGMPEHITHSDIVTVYLVQSLDTFLIAVVLMYFAFSLYHLFLSKDLETSARLFPGHIAPKGIRQLKQTLAEVIIVILFILFLQEIWVELDNPHWELLIVPLSIALMALSLKLLSFRH